METGDLHTDYLSVTPEADGARLVLRLAGEIDIATAPLLKQHLDAIHSDGIQEIILDLSQVTFLGSTGLRVLSEAKTRALAAGQQLSLHAVSTPARQVIEFAGMTSLIEIID